VSSPGGGRLAVFERLGGNPAEDLAFEEVILRRAAAGRAGVAVVSWPGPVVVLGYGQPAADVDFEHCRRRGIPVLRRITGGTGVIHAGDLAVSLALPAGHPWAKAGITGLYGRFLDVISAALRDSGVAAARAEGGPPPSRVRSPVCFEDHLADTLLVGGRKAVGCAQARRKRAVLVHAAILFGFDPGLYASVFRVDAARIAAAVGALPPGTSRGELTRAIVRRLGDGLALEPAVEPPPPLPEDLLARYREPRWAPNPG